MPARLSLVIAITGLLAVPTVASAVTKNGLTPLAPKAGSSIPVGERPVMKVRVKGAGQVWIHVCKNKRKNSEGLICPTNQESIGRARKKGSSHQYKPKFFDFPEFWLNSPGTYYWQAHRIACEGGDISDCRQEGPVVKFRVG
jgi:hypothetical protein